MSKLIWITGASSGIGAATAKKLAHKGFKVAISARSKDKLDALAENNNIYAYPLDVTDNKACHTTFRKIEDDLGPVDIALFCAGYYEPDTVEDFTAERFEKHIKINVLGTIHSAEPALEAFKKRKRGHISIVSSVAGYRGLPRSLSYGPSKAALINFAESLAIEVKPYNIKVQLINPGFVETPMTAQNDFEMPMKMKVEDAADKLIDGLMGHRFEITFPRIFALCLKAVGVLPDKLYFDTVRKITKQ